MTNRHFLRSTFLSLFCVLVVCAYPALADTSHARIIRLSLVQGDVRFTSGTHGDPLADDKALWETASLNLPIRQGYVLATDNGRAEVEFENGAMAFLAANTILEFYDLSLQDGARTTRLVLRQGSASFYVNPARGDYFSVTGGDFTVEAAFRSSFRLDDFDDGSNVNVSKGRVIVLHKDNPTPLDKGQSLSMKAGDDATSIARLAASDDFDRWVSGRIDSVTTASNAALQYANSPNYSAGFADLYTYGAWLPMSGYGYGWRPFGAGFGWSPFDNGSWNFSSGFGWSFVGSQPWGWAPYHFGSWIFDPVFGWVWIPGGFGYGNFVNWRPATVAFVRSNRGLLGYVPIHPADAHGKTPVNLSRGVFSLEGKFLAGESNAGSGENWKVLKTLPREEFHNTLATVQPPSRVSRTLVSGNSGGRIVTLSKDSSIAYDPREHRFVNNVASANSAASEKISENSGKPAETTGATRTSSTLETPRASAAVAAARTSVPSRTRSVPPPPPPPPARNSGPQRGFGAEESGSGRSSSASGSTQSTTTPAPRASAARPH